MPEEKKESLHPEVTFLPPLEMILSSFERGEQKRTPGKPSGDRKAGEKTVEKLIEKLSEKDE
jgi:hypothetical protein